MFEMNHYNYAHWLPVHIRDMELLKERHPAIYEEFLSGKFVVHKTSHAFSMIALDHNHEQENAKIKGEGGAVGLTEDPAVLRCWLIAGPEIARVVNEFETTFLSHKADDVRHHEQVPSIQAAFAKDVRNMLSVMDELGSPFLDDSKDLIALDTKDIMPERVVESVKNAHRIGVSQYNSYMEERLEKCLVAVTDTISKNDLPLFGSPQPSKSKTKQQIAALKNDCNLFTWLYFACQTRDGNLEEFIKHENQSTPPSLSTMGKIRIGHKSDLLPCLETGTLSKPPVIDVKILDSAAIVNMLPRDHSKTFEEYAKNVFLPYLEAQARNVKRLDVVWDRYIQDSLKNSVQGNLMVKVFENGLLQLLHLQPTGKAFWDVIKTKWSYLSFWLNKSLQK